MMLTQEKFEKVIEAFYRNDVPALLDSFAENGEWEMMGHEKMVGRETIKGFFDRNPGVEMLEGTKDHIVINGNTAVVDGQAKCRESNGKITEMWYCDLYEFENDKVKLLRSYVIDKK